MAGLRQIAHLAAALLIASWLSADPARGQERPDASQSPPPRAESIQFGISIDSVPVSSDFTGQDIVVFGSIENASRIAQVYNEYAVAVTIRGPMENVVVRRKERIFGIWANRESRVYRNVPSFYAVAASRPVSSIAEQSVLRQVHLGVDNLSLSLFSSGTQTYILPAPEFAGSLRRIRKNEGRFIENEGGVVFLGTSLFRATIRLPSNVPIGTHDVTVYLFRNGELVTSRVGHFEVRKVGFEQWIYTLAHSYSFLYGLMAVFVALATGWLASVIFGNRR